MSKVNESLVQAAAAGVVQWELTRPGTTPADLKLHVAVSLYRQFDQAERGAGAEEPAGLADRMSAALRTTTAGNPNRQFLDEIRSMFFGLAAMLFSVLLMLLTVQIADPEHRRYSVWVALIALSTSIVFLGRKVRKRKMPAG